LSYIKHDNRSFIAGRSDAGPVNNIGQFFAEF